MSRVSGFLREQAAKTAQRARIAKIVIVIFIFILKRTILLDGLISQILQTVVLNLFLLSSGGCLVLFCVKVEHFQGGMQVVCLACRIFRYERHEMDRMQTEPDCGFHLECQGLPGRGGFSRCVSGDG